MEDSLFTKIIKGDIPCHKIYEDDRVIAFLDVHPLHVVLRCDGVEMGGDERGGDLIAAGDLGGVDGRQSNADAASDTRKGSAGRNGQGGAQGAGLHRGRIAHDPNDFTRPVTRSVLRRERSWKSEGRHHRPSLG